MADPLKVRFSRVWFHCLVGTPPAHHFATFLPPCPPKQVWKIAAIAGISQPSVVSYKHKQEPVERLSSEEARRSAPPLPYYYYCCGGTAFQLCIAPPEQVYC